MFKKMLSSATLVSVLLLSGCASVPLAPTDKDAAIKIFSQPAEDKAGLYIFRNTFGGQALKKTVSIDGAVVGETANRTYFYRDISPGPHTLSTESEFSDNSIVLQAEGGKNYYVEQYIKMGVFVGGANLRIVSEEEGKKNVLRCKLAL